MTGGGDQVIPRPAGARAGGPPPWEGVAPAARTGIGLRQVMEAVGGPVPAVGSEVPPPLLSASGAPSAVLVALFEEGGDARVVLTRRAGHLRSHRHEVSFPGGRLEPGEAPEQGAGREAAEEVGLDPAALRIVGRLSPLVTVSSMSLIVPVVAVLAERPALAPNPAEVARAFDVSLAELADRGVFREERWPIRSPGVVPGHAATRLAASEADSYPVWFFELAGETIWGATARVLVELLTRVLVRGAPAPPGRRG